MIASLLFGASLTALGGFGYYLTGRASKTALIPAFFGLPVCALAAVGWALPAMAPGLLYGAIGIAVLGLIGTGRALVTWGASLLPNGQEARAATVSKALMAIACLGFLATCVNA